MELGARDCLVGQQAVEGRGIAGARQLPSSVLFRTAQASVSWSLGSRSPLVALA